jgi:hypothetical protein
MTIYDSAFNAVSIYNMLFLNVKAVLIYPTLEILKKENELYYDYWQNMANSYNADKEIFYQNNAILYPEFSKIVATTYGKVEPKNGLPERNFKRVVNNDEFLAIAPIIDFLQQLGNDPKQFPTLSGYNIISYDIPFLIKRFFVNMDKFENKKLPTILKNCLNSKTWDTSAVDIVGLWKFNGNYSHNVPLDLIANFWGLEKKGELHSPAKLSKLYWDNVGANPEGVLKSLSLQSTTHTNLVFQFLNKFREL